jgi:hypothetical protein
VSCAAHGYLHVNATISERLRVPAGSDYSIEYSIVTWILGFKNNKHIDNVSWPDNKACAGATVNLNLNVM